MGQSNPKGVDAAFADKTTAFSCWDCDLCVNEYGMITEGPYEGQLMQEEDYICSDGTYGHIFGTTDVIYGMQMIDIRI